MTDFLHPENEFLRKLIAVIEENLADEKFEVPDLADRVNMSRSNLLRKVKKLTGLSVSVFIRQVRLHHSKELLKDESLTVSEVSFKVGFSSTSYFTKCFRESFDYTPGEEKRIQSNQVDEEPESGKRRVPILVMLTVVAVVVALFVNRKDVGSQEPVEKSIAVLPFKNDSNDTTNIYLINGLMEAILDNLYQIEDLEVTSRTSVEKYRGGLQTIPELSEELNVNYFVEGSGQKLGDQILLTIQLIDAKSDSHVWSQQYQREVKDIFKLQMEVAANIAEEIEAIITPEEQKRLEKVPTENLAAYDYYLKGVDLTNRMTGEGLVEAIEFFGKAIDEDSEFAKAYAHIAICYYYLDIYQANQKYKLEINTYADKALLYDTELAESLMAKALYYMQDEQYEFAANYFEKALTYSTSPGVVHNFLSDIYANYLPNTQKYLTHALRGIRVSVADQDSTTASYTYLHLSNALAQTGFIKEAEKYIQTSIDYDQQNLFSEYLFIYIRLAQNFDLNRTKKELITTWQKDTMRVDILQEIAKVCYTMEDYEEAWVYYEKFIQIKQMLDLDIFHHEDLKIAYVLEQLGKKEEAQKYYKTYREYVENDESIYYDLSLCGYYAAIGDVENGIKHLEAFTTQRDYFYWLVLFLEKDPILNQLASHPDFDETIKKISENFWDQHQEIRKVLEEAEVI